MTDLVGSTLGDYTVEALIGTGSLGHVYRARHGILRHVLVALKVLDRLVTDAPEFRVPFAQYRETITRLDHAHIVIVDHFGEDGGRVYLVMELLSGRTCESLRPPSPVAVWTASSWRTVELLRQAAEGAAAAHHQGISHGDIKASNLLLTDDGDRATSVKVGDFGLRRLALAARAGHADGEARAADAAGDIAALGRVLYELTTGHRLADGEGGAISRTIAAPRQVVAGYPEALESIVLRCLSSSPADSFASVTELSQSLGAAIGDAYASAQPASAGGAITAESDAVGLLAAATVVRNAAKPPPAPSPLFGTTPALHVVNADGTSIVARPLCAAGLVVGAASGCDIVLASADVSPAHIRVDWDGHKVLVTDLGSANGTRLEGHRLLPQVAQEWGREQWLQIGSHWLWIQQPAEPPPPAVIEVMLDHSSRRLTLTPGKAAVCHLTLVNQTMHVDHVTLTVDGIPGEWVEETRTETWLAPNAKKKVSLTARVPKTPAGRAGEYRVTIRVNSVANPEVEQGSATAHWTVLPFHEMNASITPGRSRALRRAQYTVRLQNGGNVAVPCALQGGDEEKHLEYLFSGEGINDVNQLPLVIEPAAKIDIKLAVVAPRRWFGAPGTHRFTVHAASADQHPVVATEAHFVHRPILPWWALAAIPVLLLATVIFGNQYLKPVVRTVYVEPRTPQAGELVVVSWDASKARQLRLFVNDLAVQPDPDLREGRYVFPEGFNRDTRIRVSASNIFGEASSQVAIPVIQPGPPPPPPPPDIDMTVTPPSVAPGGEVRVSWRIEHAVRANFNLTGKVSMEGSYVDRPMTDQTYTITAQNSIGVATTLSIPVRIVVGDVPDPELGLSILTPQARNNEPLKIDVGKSIVFEWKATNAQSVRIEVGGVGPVKLEGSSGQRAVQPKGEGQYTFTLVATNAKNVEFFSKPIVVVADCPFFGTILKGFKCNKTLEVEWK